MAKINPVCASGSFALSCFQPRCLTWSMMQSQMCSACKHNVAHGPHFLLIIVAFALLIQFVLPNFHSSSLPNNPWHLCIKLMSVSFNLFPIIQNCRTTCLSKRYRRHPSLLPIVPTCCVQEAHAFPSKTTLMATAAKTHVAVHHREDR